LIVTKHAPLKTLLSFCLISLIINSVLFYGPIKESAFLNKLQIQFVRDAENDELVFTFLSDSMLFYENKIEPSSIVIEFKNICIHENKEFLPEAFIESVFYHYYDPTVNSLFCAFALEEYPYPYFESSTDYRSHRLALSKIPQRVLFNQTIIIDPGHGAFDEETMSIYDPGVMRGDLIESKINLELSFLLKKRLEKRGAKVILTREEEFSKENLRLQQRFDFVNSFNPTLFLSLHQNDSDYTYPNGVFLYYEHASSLPLAKMIFLSLGKGTGLKLNHILNDPLLTLKSVQAKYGLLIECAFFSNEIDRNRFKKPTFLDDLAKSIEAGIIRYFAKL
jgi:N-acetylmuramoyl-L-alanine amidase